MLPLHDFPAFPALVLFSALLVLKMGAVAVATSVARRNAKVVLNPEDTKVNPGSHAASEEAPGTLRAKRAHQNDVENIPGFLFLALLFTLAGCSASAGKAGKSWRESIGDLLRMVQGEDTGAAASAAFVSRARWIT